jgi:hypothetical protein
MASHVCCDAVLMLMQAACRLACQLTCPCRVPKLYVPKGGIVPPELPFQVFRQLQQQTAVQPFHLSYYCHVDRAVTRHMQGSV